MASGPGSLLLLQEATPAAVEAQGKGGQGITAVNFDRFYNPSMLINRDLGCMTGQPEVNCW
jgi:tRNA G26 N,N-dimethylase Trm1